jgi:hypothetical protein
VVNVRGWRGATIRRPKFNRRKIPVVLRIRAAIVAVLLVAAIGGLPGLVPGAHAAERAVTVATYDVEPFVITEGNVKYGFTIDLLDEIAKRAGWRYTYVDSGNVPGLLRAVQEGRADLGASNISITAERERTFDFSQPIIAAGLPLPAETRDAIYVAVSTDTGSFQYPSTTAKTYEMAADLIHRGLDVGTINSLIYDNYPFRRVELMRELLNTLQISADGLLAHWELRDQTRIDLALLPEDSEGLIDIIRAIRGVQLAVFFEELIDGKIRISMRSKTRKLDVCQIAMEFGGGGHALAAGIRMAGPLEDAKAQVLGAIHRRIQAADL